MSLETEHHGYTIRYSENEDLWTCMDLEVRAKTLSLAKKAIQKELKKLREKAAVPVLIINGHKPTEGLATDAKKPRHRFELSEGWDHSIAVMAVRHRNETRSKRFEKPEVLALPTEETYRAIENARIKRRRAEEADREYRAACEAIPRVKPEDLAELIRVATQEDDQ